MTQINNAQNNDIKFFGVKPPIIMTDSMFEQWRKYIYDLCGIYFQDNKKYLLESRLQKRLTYLGIDDFEAYLDYVRFNPNRQTELRYLYEAITINETYFFRNQPQLDALIESIIPNIIKQKSKDGLGKLKIRIWSAAASSGEEAYSTAMVLNELVKSRHPYIDFEIIGTDISFAMVEMAKKGIYKEYSVRNTPPYYLKKYFTPNGAGFEISDAIKKMADFKIMNLYDDTSMKQMINFDIIFCANVLIYFDMKSKIKTVAHLYNSLNKGGYLFIGYSETLHQISKAFKLISLSKTIVYNKE